MLMQLLETTKEISPFDFTNEVLLVKDMDSQQQEGWLKNTGTLLQKTEAVENLTLMMQASILYHVYELWEQNSIKTEAKAPWEYDFYKWAIRYTQRRAIQPAIQTINNKITVYRDWVANPIAHPKTVFLPKRDEKGTIVPNLEDETQWEEIQFDPMKTDYGKLLIARGAARKGDLTEDAWAAIMDPLITARELKTYLISEKALEDATKSEENTEEPEITKPDDLEIYEQEGILYGKNGEETVAVVTFCTENSSSETYRRAASLLLQMFGLQPSPEVFENDPIVIIK